MTARLRRLRILRSGICLTVLAVSGWACSHSIPRGSKNYPGSFPGDFHPPSTESIREGDVFCKAAPPDAEIKAKDPGVVDYRQERHFKENSLDEFAVIEDLHVKFTRSGCVDSADRDYRISGVSDPSQSIADRKFHLAQALAWLRKIEPHFADTIPAVAALDKLTKAGANYSFGDVYCYWGKEEVLSWKDFGGASTDCPAWLRVRAKQLSPTEVEYEIEQSTLI